MQFQYNLPVNILFGRGKISETGVQAAKYGNKALIVTGRGSTKKTGLLDKVAGLLKEAGVESVVFDQVEQNPLTTTVAEGAEVAKKTGCNVVIGLGGGSPLDAAKGIAFLAVNDGDISDYIYVRKTSDKALPLVLIPTTCGTGSEGNGFAVLSHPVTHDKKSLRCNAIIAKASIVDPELMLTLPRTVLASVGFEALCHNMEAYLSAIGNPVTDILSIEGMKRIAESLPKVYNDYGDWDAWESLTWGSTLGGMVIGIAGVLSPHGLEHPASGLHDIVHGKGLAVLTPVIFEASICGAPEKFAVISRILGGTDENDCVKKIRELLAKIDLTPTLGEQGIQEEDIDWMAENCLKVMTAGMANSPVVFGLEDLKRIYRKAL